MAPHLPVLLEDVVQLLNPPVGGVVLDGTAGFGGHALALAQRIGPGGTLVAVDRDPDAIAWLERVLGFPEGTGPRVVLCRGAFGDLGEHAKTAGLAPGSAHAILLDLGVSSAQLDQAGRGFSFQQDGPLDARMDPNGSITAADLVRDLSEQELSQLFWRHGDERHARRIARALCDARRLKPITRTRQLADLVEGTIGRRGRIHPATRVFQALRIAVNDESGQLEMVLQGAVDLLAPGGRVAVLSYHSHEDRAVKHWMRQESATCVCPDGIPECRCQQVARLRRVTRKVVRASEQEIQANPRARSARLRVAERLGGQG